MKKNKPDNRQDNPERIQRNISSTIQNIELANEMIETTSDEKAKKELKEKNIRRKNALEGMKKELKDETEFQEDQ